MHCGWPFPRREPGQPPPHVRPVLGVRRPEATLERRLLIENHEGEERRPQEHCVHHQHRVAENERLAEDDSEDSEIHRVPHVPVQPRHDEGGSGRDRRRSAKPLERETAERLHDDGRAQNGEEIAERATCRRQRVSIHGTYPATIAGATQKKTKEPSSAPARLSTVRASRHLDPHRPSATPAHDRLLFGDSAARIGSAALGQWQRPCGRSVAWYRTCLGPGGRWLELVAPTTRLICRSHTGHRRAASSRPTRARWRWATDSFCPLPLITP